MDPKRPPFPGPPGVTRMPWMPSAGDQGPSPDQPSLGRARGLVLPKDEPLPGRSRVPGEVPVRFGSAITVRQPAVGVSRGVRLPTDAGGFGRARGFLLPGFGMGRGAPVGPVPTPDIKKADVREKRPVLQTEVTPAIAQIAAPGPGSSLMSMFRGLGIEPGKTWGRGATPVGRGAAGDLGTDVQSADRSDSEREESGLEESFSFLGRGFVGVGRAALPHIGVGRGRLARRAPFLPLRPRSLKKHRFLQERPRKLKEPLQKTGTKGSPVSIGSNYIPICCKNEAVFQYHVTFTPNIESLSMRFGMMKEHRSTTGEVVAFDGSILYLPKRLEEVVHLKAERKTDNQEIDIKIQLTKILPPSSDLCIPFYNVVLRRVMKLLGLKLVGRNHYDPNAVVILGKHRLQVWPGYSTSIKHTDGGLYLVVDVSHKVLRNDSVLDVMNLIYQGSRESFQTSARRSLWARSPSRRYNNRISTVIDDIEWSKSPKDTFTLADGTVTTFVDYYRKNYGIAVKELDQPLLIHRPKERSRPGGKVMTGEILLLPELSFMTGIPEKMRKDFRAMRVQIRSDRTSTWGAEQHTRSLKQLLHNINSSNEALSELGRWGLGVSQEILVTQGRTLPNETICLHSASFISDASGVDWSRGGSRPLYQHLLRFSCICLLLALGQVPLNCWAVFYPRRATDQAEELVTTFTKVAGPMGIKIERPIRSGAHGTIVTETFIKSIHSQLTSEALIPRLSTFGPSLSQRQKLQSIGRQKILLQINCKLGGELWTGERLLWVTFQMPLRGDNQQLQGLSADGPVKYYAAISRRRSRLHFPEKIVIYRDGVSDGQPKTVELYDPQVLKCFETIPTTIRLAFIVVQKRISTTLYSCGSDQFARPRRNRPGPHRYQQRLVGVQEPLQSD
ncbi:piwi-like protein 2 [Puntigrus tetrazona]|uniref:piwi-like protein 2 n=1 Tax=Puntigrus tetrazona TaxID=1606681 RepID=UPI001C8A2E74|nr:piwi-like protein 2 [Puntigrus tetrazona]